jgi:hypothetical protein
VYSHSKLVLVLAATLTSAPVNANDWTWTGETSSDWHIAGNWDCTGDCQTQGGLAVPNHQDARVTIPQIQQTPTYPVISNDSAVISTLTIEQYANVTITGSKTLEFKGKDPITLDGSQARILMHGGTLWLRAAEGGIIRMAAQAKIEFPANEGGGTIKLDSDTLPFVIYKDFGGNPPQPPSDEFDAIVAHETAVIEFDDGLAGDVKRPTLVLARYGVMRGNMNILTPLVNNGIVRADIENCTVLLSGTPKMGQGLWHVNASGAKIHSKIPIVGYPCSNVLVQQGTLKIEDSWVSCGEFRMKGGALEVAPDVLVLFSLCNDPLSCLVRLD